MDGGQRQHDAGTEVTFHSGFVPAEPLSPTQELTGWHRMQVRRRNSQPELRGRSGSALFYIHRSTPIRGKHDTYYHEYQRTEPILAEASLFLVDLTLGLDPKPGPNCCCNIASISFAMLGKTTISEF